MDDEIEVITVEVPAAPTITVLVPGEQGPGNIIVGPTNVLSPGVPGLWIQTGLGDGSDFTFWIEDGE